MESHDKRLAMATPGLLVQEITKILTARYPMSLTPFSRVLKIASHDDVLFWSCAKPCQIKPFIANLISTSAADEHATQALARLARVGILRDELLLQNPPLLAQLIFTSSTDSVQQCLSLLDSPLPETFAVSQSCLAYFETMMSNASGYSPQIWMQIMTQMFNALGANVLQLVSNDVVRYAHQTWEKVLKSNDNFEFLCCLDIACILGPRITEGSLSDGSTLACSAEDRPEQEWRLSCRALLDNKASRLIQPLLLRALHFLCTYTESTLKRATDAARMIKRILERIDAKTIHAAMQDKKNIAALRKLIDKTTNIELPTMLRLTIFGVVAILDPTAQQWHSLIAAPLAMILTPMQANTLVVFGKMFTNTVIGVLKGIFLAEVRTRTARMERLQGVCVFRTILQFLIDICQHPGELSGEDLLKIKHGLAIVEALRNITRSGNIYVMDIECLQDLALGEHVKRDSDQPDDKCSCTTTMICPHEFHIKQQTLLSCFSDWVLEVACINGIRLQSNTYQWLSQQIKDSSMVKHNKICGYDMPCHDTSANTTKFQVPELSNKPQQVQNLDEQLLDINNKTCEVIRHHIKTRCRELEARCEDVEAPLREERAKVINLEKELQMVHLQSDQAQHRWQSEKNNLQNEVNCIRCDLDDTRIELAQVNEAYQLDRGTWQTERQELEHALETAHAEAEELLVQKQSDCINWQSRLEETNSQLQEVTHALDAAKQEINDSKVAQQQILDAKNVLSLDHEASTEHIRQLKAELSEVKAKEKKLLAVLCDDQA